ncbi:MAG: (2Fe-2S) ferredoxin domain-containing protein [Candidatus Omnitrophica bacterium]|nr:(2Fe-2S) ferredoxin domain-containing protein [Candidatus Omnitrophota bacterium]
MERASVPYEKILFVCTNVRDAGICCSERDSVAIRNALKQYVKDHRLQGRIRVSQSGCQDLCAQGPNIMVFPDNVWYHHVRLEEVPQIIEAHLAPLDASTKPLTGGA